MNYKIKIIMNKIVKTLFYLCTPVDGSMLMRIISISVFPTLFPKAIQQDFFVTHEVEQSHLDIPYQMAPVKY